MKLTVKSSPTSKASVALKSIEVPYIVTTCEKSVLSFVLSSISKDELVMSCPNASKFAHVIYLLIGSLTLMLTLFDENLRPFGLLKFRYSKITCSFAQYLCLAVNVIV